MHPGMGWENLEAYSGATSTVKITIKDMHCKGWIHDREKSLMKALPRSGRLSKLDDWARRTLIREASTRPVVTLKEMQVFRHGTGQSVHVITIFQALHKAGLYDSLARKKTFLKKCHTLCHLCYAKRHLKDTLSCGTRCHCEIWPNWPFWTELQLLSNTAHHLWNMVWCCWVHPDSWGMCASLC